MSGPRKRFVGSRLTGRSATTMQNGTPSQDKGHQPASGGTQPTVYTIRTPGQVTESMKQQLKDLVERVKAYHTPGQSVTDQEMTLFVQLVMKKWDTNMAHSVPRKGSVQCRLEDRAVEVGTLRRNLTMSKSAARAARLAGASIPVQTDPWRQAGAPLYSRVRVSTPRACGTFSFQRIDGLGRCILDLDDIKDMYDPGMQDRKDRYLACMIAHDSFYLRVYHPYNLKVATFQARNRLALWAAGAAVGTRPESEDTTLFHTYDLCRNRTPVPHAPEAVEVRPLLLSAVPRRGLFDLI